VVKKYIVRFTPEAVQDLKKLDRIIAERLLRKIRWFSENQGIATPLPLQNNLRGKYKLRAGDWRVIYELDEKLGEMVVLFAGHRSEVYKR
jgi:mRNA interferase RelE/StbE